MYSNGSHMYSWHVHLYYIYIYILCVLICGGVIPLEVKDNIFDPCRYTRSAVCWNGFRFPWNLEQVTTTSSVVNSEEIFCWVCFFFKHIFLVILWMEEILHYLGWLKAYKEWDKPAINWCRISQPSTVSHESTMQIIGPPLEDFNSWPRNCLSSWLDACNAHWKGLSDNAAYP